MIQKQFAERAAAIVKEDDSLIGLAVGGSWLTAELDEFSDLDCVLVTKEKIPADKALMLHYANRFGKLLNGFTAEHVGEPRLLICLYGEPLLHVDIKFITLKELETRVEDPFILVDKNDQLKAVIQSSTARFPLPDYQWMEDRFWIWIHYTASKIGRGEYLETVEALSYLRAVVLGPLLSMKAGKLPRGVRRAESWLAQNDLQALQTTVATLERTSLLDALENCVQLYRRLRDTLFTNGVALQTQTEQSVMLYFNDVKKAQ